MRHLLYRLGQYRRARHDRPSAEGLMLARAALSPQLFELFSRMLPFEQAHAIRVYQGLVAAGQHDPDLLAAGLLHDIGKVRRPLRPWERSLAVIFRALLPQKFAQWGQAQPTRLTAGVVVAARHAEWGAQMAAEAGASMRLVWLIRHHDAEIESFGEEDQEMLSVLQTVDAVS